MDAEKRADFERTLTSIPFLFIYTYVYFIIHILYSFSELFHFGEMNNDLGVTLRRRFNQRKWFIS